MLNLDSRYNKMYIMSIWHPMIQFCGL